MGSIARITVVGATLALIAACSRTGLLVDGIDDLAADAGAIVPCTPGTFDLTRAVPAVMFVLDRSGSMDDDFSDGESRWQVLTNGLSSTLPPVDDSIEIGALLFPNGGNGIADGLSCALPTSVNLAPATGHVASLVALMEQTEPSGGTPTDGALARAASSLQSVRAATSARAIVLATDGAPNCNSSLPGNSCTCADPNANCTHDGLECLDDTRTVASIASYASEGLPTYVIGIQSAGDTTLTNVLNAMAAAGGRPQAGAATSYYAATSATELDNALVAIRNQVGECTFLTTSVPGTAGSIVVTLNGTVIPYDPTGKIGWSWGDKANGQILFASAICQQIAAATSETLDAQVACSVPDAGNDAGDAQ